jgi:hypothetical protein
MTFLSGDCMEGRRDGETRSNSCGFVTSNGFYAVHAFGLRSSSRCRIAPARRRLRVAQ